MQRVNPVQTLQRAAPSQTHPAIPQNPTNRATHAMQSVCSVRAEYDVSQAQPAMSGPKRRQQQPESCWVLLNNSDGVGDLDDRLH